MSRNQNSHFAMAPHANVPRSRMDMSHGVKFTMNAGKLVPFELREILPGDTFEVNTSILARMQTLIVPLMDDVYLDVYYFYVPSRLLWKHYEAMCGDTPEPWFDDTEYTFPQIEVDIAPGAQNDGITNSVKKGTVADYLGMPLAVESDTHTPSTRKFNHLPFRAYVKVWNDWFRDINTQALAAFNTEDNDVVMNNTGDAFYGGELLPVNKYRDYFTSCLPEPQRGDPVSISVSGNLPVTTMTTNWSENLLKNGNEFVSPMRLHSNGTQPSAGTLYNIYGRGYASGASGSEYSFVQTRGTLASGTTEADPLGLAPANLVALGSEAGSISINELRYAFATQRYLEQLARSGNRYISYLEGVYGVTSPDARLQRSEYLGGQRLQLNINQAVQNSETGTTPLGNIGAYSVTTDNQHGFQKSFVEAGYLLGLCCVRYDHSYQNGFEDVWLKKNLDDIYNPFFANIGEMPVRNIEIYADGSNADDEVFGYQEAWSSYRYANNRVAGEMRSNYAQSLDAWHLADDYTSRPYLDDEWQQENGQTIDRTIAVSQRVSDQFLVDMWMTMYGTRPMPLFSVPGLDIL